MPLSLPPFTCKFFLYARQFYRRKCSVPPVMTGISSLCLSACDGDFALCTPGER